jgi:hypothetical protein
MHQSAVGLLTGTLEMLVLKTLTLGPQHGWGISRAIEELSGQVFAVNQGAIYRRCSGCGGAAGSRRAGARRSRTGVRAITR